MEGYLANTNRALIIAMGMHWENEAAKQRGETPPYGENQFIELTLNL